MPSVCTHAEESLARFRESNAPQAARVDGLVEAAETLQGVGLNG